MNPEWSLKKAKVYNKSTIKIFELFQGKSLNCKKTKSPLFVPTFFVYSPVGYRTKRDIFLPARNTHRDVSLDEIYVQLKCISLVVQLIFWKGNVISCTGETPVIYVRQRSKDWLRSSFPCYYNYVGWWNIKRSRLVTTGELLYWAKYVCVCVPCGWHYSIYVRILYM